MARMTTRRAGGAQAAPSIPKTMKAAVMTGYGGPDMIEIGELPVPGLGVHDIMIRVAAAGVGIWDAALRRGDWGTEGAHPKVLGSDGAGVVVARGERVTEFALGDAVFACQYLNPKGGFHAEYAVVDASKAHRVPSRLTLDQAAAIATTGVTALAGVERLALKKGDVALIFGATGGVGSMAVQLAKRAGAQVIGTASGDAARTYVHELGCDACYDARAQSVEHALEVLGATALDAALAFAGGPALDEALERVKADGRVAFPNGVEPEPRAGKKTKVKVESYDGIADSGTLERLTRAIEEIPAFEARVEEAFPLEQAARAHERIEKGRVLGKVILRIGERRPAERRRGR